MVEPAKRTVRNMYFDEYEVVDIISQTRLSTIYKARSHFYPDQFFAIKVVGDTFKRPGEILKKEAEILDELRGCPFIVKSRGYHQTEDGIPYIVMDYIDGKHPLKVSSAGYSKQRIKPEQVRFYVEHIAKALDYAHHRKICHCDIRPENILIVEDNHAILCDFGLAVKEKDNFYHYHDERDEAGNELTLNKKYLPLERYLNDPVIDPKGDQFSLAAFVFECLYGEAPSVTGNSSIKQQVQVINEKYSPKIGAILERALAEAMADRFPSVDEFANKLIKELDDYIAKNKSQPPPLTPNSAGTSETTPPKSSQEVSSRSLPSQTTRQNQSPQRMFSRREILAVAAALPAAVFLPMTWVRLWSDLSHLLVEPTLFGQTIDVYQGHSRTVNALSWSPDGQWIASVSADSTIQVWQPGGGSEPVIRTIPGGNVLDVAWSQYPNNNLLAFCSGKSVYIWDFPNALPVNVYNAKGAITSLAWSPDLPPSLAIASDRGEVLILQFVGVEVQGQQPITYTAPTMKAATRLTDIAWSNDSVYLATCSNSNSPFIWVWNVNDGSQQQLVKLPGTILSIAWSPKVETILAAGLESDDPNVEVLNIFDSEKQPLEYHHMEISTGIDIIAWSPNKPSSSTGTYIAAGADSGYVYVWNAQTRAYKPYDKHLQSTSGARHSTNASIDIKALAWSPDGTMIASGGTDSTVRVWASGIGTF